MIEIKILIMMLMVAVVAPYGVYGQGQENLSSLLAPSQEDLYSRIEPSYTLDDYDRLVQYCFDHVDRVVRGENPIKDLVNAQLIPFTFTNDTCATVVQEKELAHEFMTGR